MQIDILKIVITELKLKDLFGDNNELMKLYCTDEKINIILEKGKKTPIIITVTNNLFKTLHM